MCYTYDDLSRVTTRTIKKASDNSVVSTENFGYDAAGNVTSAPDSSFQYDTNNRLISFNGNTVSYDLDGNMLSNGSLTCTYDSANRLVSAGGHTYTYNAEDVRIRNLCTDEDTTYTYDTNCKLSKLLCKTTNGVTTKYVYGRGLIGEETNNAFKTYHFDCRGSTIAITDASGNITDTFAYDTYGKLINRTGTSEIIFGYNGRDGVVTEDNGLIYMRARYYLPEMKRFINEDIVAGKLSNAITLNRFAYANGNPVSFVDPFGLSVERGVHPTALEAAYMAQHIYDAEIQYDNNGVRIPIVLFGEWELIDIKINSQGLKMGLYAKTIHDVTSYSVVNAGSETDIKNDFSGVWNDWVMNNLTQPFGNSQDMIDSIAYAKYWANKYKNSNITFIGHSKGGAEAIANAVATKSNAVVFNPATAKLSEYDLDVNKYTGNVTSYVVEGEMLDTLSSFLGKNIGEEIQLISPYNHDAPNLSWDPVINGALDPAAQLGQYLGGLLANYINSNIEKHDIALIIDLLTE